MARLHLLESRLDIDIAKKLVEELQSLKHAVTWDLNFLVPGEPWKRSLSDAVVYCDGVVALLTKNCVEFNGVSPHISSQWIAADIGAARAYGKFVIPVILGDDALIPALVDDLYAIIESDAGKLREIAGKIDTAVSYHLKKIEKESMLNLPAAFSNLAPAVVKFNTTYSYDTSVFVMMKFPDRTTMAPEKCQFLDDIWNMLKDILHSHGLEARRADKNTYDTELWGNLCVHMLGCKYGIAILEDIVAAEFNPNVALEYGFMRAVNAHVGLFKNEKFNHDRADIIGTLAKTFAVDDNGQLNKLSFSNSITEWLTDQGFSKKFNA